MYRVDAISRILSAEDGGIIYLGSASPPTSSGVPGAFWGTGRSTAPVSPCSRWGLPGQRHCCRCRCALTAPFHPRSVSTAIFSLLHLPSGYPARPLTGIVALRSADFPRQAHDPPRFPWSTRRLYCSALGKAKSSLQKRCQSRVSRVSPNLTQPPGPSPRHQGGELGPGNGESKSVSRAQGSLLLQRCLPYAGLPCLSAIPYWHKLIKYLASMADLNEFRHEQRKPPPGPAAQPIALAQPDFT